MKTIFSLITAVVMVFGVAVQAHADLITIGTATYNSTDYNLIYDDCLGIVWLDYTADDDTWDNQVAWAAGLNATSVLTYNLNPGVTVSWTGDWRLPTTPGTTAGYTDEVEMGHLYYTAPPDGLGNEAGGPLTNTGDFSNLLPRLYWSGTEYGAEGAWNFTFSYGFQFADLRDDYSYALAVRPGDVGAPAPVPEPGTILLLGSGLVGLAGFRRKFRK